MRHRERGSRRGPAYLEAIAELPLFSPDFAAVPRRLRHTLVAALAPGAVQRAVAAGRATSIEAILDQDVRASLPRPVDGRPSEP